MVDNSGGHMFRGSSFHTIDPKGRLIIPTRFRDVIKASGYDGVMVTGWDHCLYAYTTEEWGKVEAKILKRDIKGDAMRRFQRKFVGGAVSCKCDRQGRILIPPFLKQYADLEKDVVLAGIVYRFEIWSTENWNREDEKLEEDLGKENVDNQIAELGL